MSKTFRIAPAPKEAASVTEKKSSAPMCCRPREHIAQLPQTEFNVGPFLVRCSNKQHYRLYSIYARPDMLMLGRQASYPSIFDCLDKLEKQYGAGAVPQSRYEAIINSRGVQQELNARSAA